MLPRLLMQSDLPPPALGQFPMPPQCCPMPYEWVLWDSEITTIKVSFPPLATVFPDLSFLQVLILESLRWQVIHIWVQLCVVGDNTEGSRGSELLVDSHSGGRGSIGYTSHGRVAPALTIPVTQVDNRGRYSTATRSLWGGLKRP